MKKEYFKCAICEQKKPSRECAVQNGEKICSLCCGKSRSWKTCNTDCIYFPAEKLNYIPENVQDAEIVNTSNGETHKFEIPLFLPNILLEIDCHVTKLEILILDFNKVRINLKFKLSSNRQIGDELYNKDSWKIKSSNVPLRNGKPLCPLLIVSTYEYGNSSLEKNSYKFGNATIESYKTSYNFEIWLPHAKTYKEKVSVSDRPEFQTDFVEAVSNEGKMSFKKRDTYWGELSTKFEYNFSVIASYSNLGIIDDGSLVIPFGFFLPFHKVSFSHVIISKPSDFQIGDNSFLTFVASKQEKVTRLSLIPLKENFKNVYHGFFNKHLLNDIKTPYHYSLENELLYTDYFIYLQSCKTLLNCSMIYYSNSIISAYFNLLDDVYNGDYSPINLIVANTTSEIIKIKIDYQFIGFSERYIKYEFIEPLKTSSIPILPKLNESFLTSVLEHMNVAFDIKIFQNDICIFEEIKSMDLLPKETFIYDMEDDGKSSKKYFYPFLARWVTPNNPIIEQIVNKASQKVDMIYGESSNEIQQVKTEISGIYNVIAENIKYVSRTFSLYKGSTSLHQKIYLPENTHKNESGNCIDLTVLLASCLEKINYAPLLMIIPESHAFLGVKLDYETLYIETTCLGYDTFEEALKLGKDQYEEHFLRNKERINHIVDIESARKNKIFPMN